MVNIVLVNRLSHARKLCHKVLPKYGIIAIDIEGVNWGEEDGCISLMQIASSNTTVYCFDILTLGSQVLSKEYLGSILESDKILKLCYDCRMDGAMLRSQHNISMQHFYDVQVLYTFAFQSQGDRFLKGLQHVLQKPGVLHPNRESELLIQNKKEIKSCLSSSGSQIFMQRPLSEQVLLYCASDVIYLFRMFQLWSALVPFPSVVQASWYRLHKFYRRNENSTNNEMAVVDFKKMPLASKACS